MASYNPPTADLTTFDSIVFSQSSGSSALTINEGDQRYVRFPIAQGSETLPSISVTGSANISGLSTLSGGATLSGTNLLSGPTSLTGGTTISTDITLNKASGSQTIVSSAPSGLTLQSTALTAPINFTCSSSGGTYTDILRISANNNPRIVARVYETTIQDMTTTTYQGILDNRSVAGGTFCIKSGSTTGNGNIQIDASTSTSGTATGSITLKTKDGTPSTNTGLILQGTALTALSAGGSAGLHLCITINGVLYKIALLNA